MSAGAMLYAVDMDDLQRAFVEFEIIPPDEMLAYLAEEAQLLANAAHSPAPFDELLKLDTILAAKKFPAKFRYAYLFGDPASINMQPAVDLPMAGSISADLVAEVASRVRIEGAPEGADEWQTRALDELCRDVVAAADRGRTIVGVYT